MFKLFIKTLPLLLLVLLPVQVMAQVNGSIILDASDDAGYKANLKLLQDHFQTGPKTPIDIAVAKLKRVGGKPTYGQFKAIGYKGQGMSSFVLQVEGEGGNPDILKIQKAFDPNDKISSKKMFARGQRQLKELAEHFKKNGAGDLIPKIKSIEPLRYTLMADAGNLELGDFFRDFTPGWAEHEAYMDALIRDAKLTARIGFVPDVGDHNATMNSVPKLQIFDGGNPLISEGLSAQENVKVNSPTILEQLVFVNRGNMTIDEYAGEVALRWGNNLSLGKRISTAVEQLRDIRRGLADSKGFLKPPTCGGGLEPGVGLVEMNAAVTWAGILMAVPDAYQEAYVPRAAANGSDEKDARPGFLCDAAKRNEKRIYCSRKFGASMRDFLGKFMNADDLKVECTYWESVYTNGRRGFDPKIKAWVPTCSATVYNYIIPLKTAADQKMAKDMDAVSKIPSKAPMSVNHDTAEKKLEEMFHYQFKHNGDVSPPLISPPGTKSDTI